MCIRDRNEAQKSIGDSKLHIELMDDILQQHDSIFSGIVELRLDSDNNIYKWHNPSSENHIYQWHNTPGKDDVFELRKAHSKVHKSKKNGNTPTDVLLEELSKDGFIPETGNHKIELTGKHLKINGDKQPANIFEKYKKIFEQELGHELTKDSKIKIEADHN